MRQTRTATVLILVLSLFIFSNINSYAQSDADGDGVPDASDSCVYRGNEGGLGVDSTGCPIYDTDGDGVIDRNDVCPAQADEYGYGVDGSGCPLTAPPATENPPVETSSEPPSETPAPVENSSPGENPSNPPEAQSSDNAGENPASPETSVPDNNDPERSRQPGTTQSDADGDGFIDSIDACPTRGNEGGLGVDYQGCPIYDTDGDGIFDHNDSCPTRGNEGGFGVDSTGCPIYDTDGDGFFDYEDSCPTKGNEGGLGVDSTGCPYYDADWDGFFDRIDACPTRADEYGFGVDFYGCPRTEAFTLPGSGTDNGDTPGEIEDGETPTSRAIAAGNILPVGQTYVGAWNGVALDDYILNAGGTRLPDDAVDYILHYLSVNADPLSLYEQLKNFILSVTTTEIPVFEFGGLQAPIFLPQPPFENNLIFGLKPTTFDVLDVIVVVASRILDITFDSEVISLPDFPDVLDVPEILVFEVESVDVSIPVPLFPPIEASIDGLEIDVFEFIVEIINFFDDGPDVPAADDSIFGDAIGLLRDIFGSTIVDDISSLAVSILEAVIGDPGNYYDSIPLLTFDNGAAITLNDFVPYEDFTSDIIADGASIGGRILGSAIGSGLPLPPPFGAILGGTIGSAAAGGLADLILDIVVEDPPPPPRPDSDEILKRDGDDLLLEIDADDVTDLEFLVVDDSDPVIYTFTQINPDEVEFNYFIP